MCTALTYKAGHHYFGRNLDLERGYGEKVVITPRNYPFHFRHTGNMDCHYAMIGMAAIADNYPLYFDATNEKGLSIAGLNFPDNAQYYPVKKDAINIASFELVPYILGVCRNIQEAKETLKNINISNDNFRSDLPASPLHWLIGDKQASITLECTKTGLQVYDNPFGVLTNNPPFSYHMTNISNFMSLNNGSADNRISREISMENYSLGMGAIGLPGDFSSASRFVKAVFVKENSNCEEDEVASVNQFFHILASVAMPKGCVKTPSGEYEYTRYSCCCNMDTLSYYFSTYENSTIRKVKMEEERMVGKQLIDFSID